MTLSTVGGRCVTSVDNVLNRQELRWFISQSIHTCDTHSQKESGINSIERKELPRASRERSMPLMHDCPSRDLERLQHPIAPLVTTCTSERRPDAHIGQ